MKQFDFGKNWISFSRHAITKERICAARKDFNNLFSGIPVGESSFLDIGYGQGFALLFAAQLGADVIGCDINSKCREALLLTAKECGIRVDFPVVTGSILDKMTIDKISALGKDAFTIVHSWGVLHHTGDMVTSLKTACKLTDKGGYLVIALYNRHWSSPLWKFIKQIYSYSPKLIQYLLIASLFPVILIAKALVTRKNPFIQQRWMFFFYDVIDWIGGCPYEYASIDEVRALVEKEGFQCLRVLAAQVPTGCNQFVFKKNR